MLKPSLTYKFKKITLKECRLTYDSLYTPFYGNSKGTRLVIQHSNDFLKAMLEIIKTSSFHHLYKQQRKGFFCDSYITNSILFDNCCKDQLLMKTHQTENQRSIIYGKIHQRMYKNIQFQSISKRQHQKNSTQKRSTTNYPQNS